MFSDKLQAGVCETVAVDKMAGLAASRAKSGGSKELSLLKRRWSVSLWYSIELDDQHTKRYHIGFPLIAELTQLQRLLLDYCCEIMTSDNIVENSIKFKSDFNRI